MATFQVWLVSALAGAKPIAAIMRTRWGWPAAESIHFIGLSMLIGMIFLFDLRLLGMAKRIPIAALHKLIPWGVLGYIINLVSGSFFLMTEPDQYIYNPAFHFKLLFMALAGFNVLVFYSTVFRRVEALGPGKATPPSAKVIAIASLCLWIGVIISGRLLTFYRPGECGPHTAVLLDCIP